MTILRTMCPAIAWLFVTSTWGQESLPLAEAPQSAEKLLQRHGIELTIAGYQRFLSSLNPEDQVNQPVQNLIDQLGSQKFSDREAATTKLVELPIVPEACLLEAAASEDAEIRDRADHILRRAKGVPQWQITQAIFQQIQDHRIKGLAAAVLDARSWIDHDQKRRMISDVLSATVVAEDLARLQDLFKRADADERKLLAGALTITLHAQSPEALLTLLNESEPQIRLIAARALMRAADRRALTILAELLTSEDAEIRAEAIAVLHSVTGQPIGYAAFQNAEQRREAMARWAAWIGEHVAEVNLRPPLQELPPLKGRVTVCLPDVDRIIELDLQGQLIEELTTAASPKGCQRQPNGNWLVASYKGRHLAEFDPGGRKLWERGTQNLQNLQGPMRVTRLANGNLLAPFLDSMTVAELDPQGKIVWKVQHNGWPMGAERLSSGNTLVSLWEYGVVEYDPAGQIVWQIDGLKMERPASAQRLPNGNTLVALNKVGRVDEFDRTGRVVWSVSYTNTRDIARLVDGSTLISEATGIRRIDQDGGLMWHYPIVGTAGMRVY